MQLDEAQRKKVAAWVAEGLKLSEIQNRLSSELGLRLTYMEVRMLVDDLKLVPKDLEPAKPAGPLLNAGAASAAPPAGKAGAKEAPVAAPSPTGGVSVTVDQLTRPGAVVSGKVTFSDGNRADWYFDQTGRLALASQQPGYRPPAEDLQQFQAALDAELSKLGL
ncbi:MAG TPA: hypothetical protein VJA21_14745 [Verrucomicrobiae bacterium]